MKQFSLAVKTMKNEQEGTCGNIVAWGTKRFCVEQMQKWFKIPDTRSAKVIRDSDGKVVEELVR